MYSLLHDIPRFFILFLEEWFLIFNQMLSILAFGRRAIWWWIDIYPDNILYLIEMPFKAFANRAGPGQAALF